MKNKNIFLLLVATIIQLGEATANCQPTLRVRAWIDGISQLVVRPDSILWDHFWANRPGLENTNEPTYINSYSWYPVWPEPDPASPWPSSPLTIQTWFTTNAVTMDIVSARYRVQIVQQPDPTNEYTLVVEFNDDSRFGAAYGGAAWYEVLLSGVWTFFTLPALNVIRSGDTLLITWPASVSGAVLESTASFPAAAWTPVPIPPVVIGDQNAVTVDIAGSAQFFRLRESQ